MAADYNKVTYIITLVILILMGAAGSGSASVFLGSDRYVLAGGDSVPDDLYLGTKEAVLDGIITGDLLIGCENYILDGKVGGSVNSGSRKVTIKGDVGNSARIFGEEITIDGNIVNNLLAFGKSIQINNDCNIGRDANVGGADINIYGHIGRNLEVNGGKILLSGQIDGDVKVKAGELTLLPPLVINGNFTYTTKKEITDFEGVDIKGETEWIELKKSEADEEEGSSGISPVLKMFLFLASLTTGLIIIGVFGRHSEMADQALVRKPLVALGVGFVVFCLAPIAIVILLPSVLATPLSILMLFAYTALFYMAKIYVALTIGRYLITLVTKNEKPRKGWAFLVGLIVLSILFMIPVIGWFVYFLTIFFGMGAVIMGVRACRIESAGPYSPVN